MASIKARWINNILTYFHRSTFERVLPVAPLVFYDDFVGAGNVVVPAAASAESGMPWAKKIVGAAPPTVAGVADGGGGLVQCALTSASQKQDAGLYMDDQRNFDITKGLIWEARVKLSVLPTLVAEAVFGLVGDWADGPDAITYSAFFTADGSGEIICEADDNATNSSATSGVTATTAQWKIYRIDFSDVTDVRFYIDGVHVATGTTFPYAATGANAILQPYIGLYKASGAGVGTVQVDYVRIWQASR
jgi:hypothetical protein